jgi:CBS domain containing-hemolysin-like protein
VRQLPAGTLRGEPTGGVVAIEIALGLAAVGLLILATAFFVGAEFSLVAVDRDRVESLAASGSRPARAVARALERLSFNLSGAQLGITVTSLVLGFIAEPTVARAVEPAFEWLPEGAQDQVSVVIGLLLVTVVTMVLGELVPKGVAVAEPLRLALLLSATIRVYGIVFGPLIRLFNGAADWAVRRMGITTREELRAIRTIDELELLIASSGEQGTLDPEAFELLTRTMRFSQKAAVDAMVPRVDMATIDSRATVADLVRVALDTGYSRFPIVAEDADDVVGVVHAKNALGIAPEDRATTPITALVSPVPFIPEGRDLESLLTEMRAGGQQLVIVADEYGSVAGLVTLEDLLEEIVGEIEDEYDVGAAPVTPPVPFTPVVAEGSLHLEEVAELTGLCLPDGPYETLAGFVLAELGHLPVAGERTHHNGWVLEVVEMDRRRIASVRLTPPEGRS